MNRIDEIIIFDPLSDEQIHQIVDIMVDEVRVRLLDHQVTISLTTSAKDRLAKEGFDPVYGARPLRRAVQCYVENPLSKKIIGGEFGEGDHILVDANEGGLTFVKDVAPVEVTAD